MKTIIFGILIWVLFSIVIGQKTFLDSDGNIRWYRAIKELAFATIGRTGAEGSIHMQEARRQRRMQERIPVDVPFPCDVTAGKSKNVPTSVHKLRPGDIDVVGAMGDSLTAGTGVFPTSIFNIAIENRGVTALGGGQGTWRDYLTIPNIIKEFNPNLIGYALRDSMTYEAESQLNVAEIGAMSRDLPYMANNLVQRMKNHPKVDMQNHWKLISILTGLNDFCTDMCWIESGPSSLLKNHKNELITTLRILKKNLPRTLISLIPPPNLQLVANSPPRSLICYIATNMECGCLFSLYWKARRKAFSDIMTRWQQLDEEIATDPEFQTDDFAVVAQPFTTNITLPTKDDETIDWRYLSADCFHLSQIANARASMAAWKNMLEPVGRKSRDWDKPETMACPTESRPYISTAVNSREESNS